MPIIPCITFHTGSKVSCQLAIFDLRDILLKIPQFLANEEAGLFGPIFKRSDKKLQGLDYVGTVSITRSSGSTRYRASYRLICSCFAKNPNPNEWHVDIDTASVFPAVRVKLIHPGPDAKLSTRFGRSVSLSMREKLLASPYDIDNAFATTGDIHCISDDGAVVFTGEHELCVYMASTGETLGPFSLDFDADRYTNIPSTIPASALPSDRYITSITCTANGKLALVACSDQAVLLFSVEDLFRYTSDGDLQPKAYLTLLFQVYLFLIILMRFN